MYLRYRLDNSIEYVVCIKTFNIKFNNSRLTTKVHCIDFDFIMILHIWSETDRINWQTSGQMIMINDVPDHAIDKENVSVTPTQYRHQIVGILGTSASTI